MIEDKIRSVLPNLTSDVISCIKDKLEELGVYEVEDLQLVERTDLEGLMKPIEIRKLLRSWNCDSLNSTTLQPVIDVGCKTSYVEIEDTSCSTSLLAPLYKLNSNSLPSTCTNVPSSTLFHTSRKSSISASFTDFRIPWEKFPLEIKEACEKNLRPMKKHLLQMIRILVSEIRKIHRNPGRDTIRTIVQKIVNEYPNSFQESIGASVIAGGCMSLMKRVETCIENQNRTNGILTSVSSDNEDTEPPVKKRKNIKDSYGCVNWQPENFPPGETRISQKEKQEWLLQEHRKENRDHKKVHDYMEITFPSQRYFINQVKPAASIKNNWPFLAEAEFLLLHCEKLLSFNVEEKIKSSISSKGKIIYNFMKTVQNRRVLELLIDIEAAKKQEKNEQAECIGSIFLVMAYFEEKIEELVTSHMVPVSDDEIIKYSSYSFPTIVTSGGNIYNAESFILVFEQNIFGITNNFAAALSHLFASYFVFNIQYNPAINATLEFIQRCFADLNPSRGSKATGGTKKGYNCNPKVLSLVNKLKDFEWF